MASLILQVPVRRMLLATAFSTTIPHGRAEYIKRKTKVATVGSFSCGLTHRFGNLLLVPPQQFVKHFDTGESCYKKSAQQMYYMTDRRCRDSSTSDRCVCCCVFSF